MQSCNRTSWTFDPGRVLANGVRKPGVRICALWGSGRTRSSFCPWPGNVSSTLEEHARVPMRRSQHLHTIIGLRTAAANSGQSSESTQAQFVPLGFWRFWVLTNDLRSCPKQQACLTSHTFKPCRMDVQRQGMESERAASAKLKRAPSSSCFPDSCLFLVRPPSTPHVGRACAQLLGGQGAPCVTRAADMLEKGRCVDVLGHRPCIRLVLCGGRRILETNQGCAGQICSGRSARADLLRFRDRCDMTLLTVSVLTPARS